MNPVQFNSVQLRSLIEVVLSGLQTGTNLVVLTLLFQMKKSVNGCIMLNIEKCIRYFEFDDPKERIKFLYQFQEPKINSEIKDFLRLLGLIEYELVTTYKYEGHNLYKGLN